MTLNMDAIGKPIGPIAKAYTWKDAVLYALGVGAGFTDLEYCYEKDLKVLPSFSIALIFDFLSHAAIASELNLAGVLHGEQELIFHNPIPSEGTLTTTGTIVDYYDKGKDKGALVVAKSDTYHNDGQKLFTNVITLFARLDGGFGGKDIPKKEIDFPERDPDLVVEDAPGADQPLIYRLSGDIFQLHVDPEFAKLAGFEKPIMHGLCTHGFACRALIRSLTPGEPEKVRRLDCRFSKTLYPGTPIKTLIWKIEEGRAVWRTVNAVNGDVIIDRGVFEYGEVPKDEIRFDDQVAVITGAGAGLGRVYALELARRGAKVVVNDLGGARDGSGQGSSFPADAVVAEIEALGGEAMANYDSVATVEGGRNIVQTALDNFGRLDILINNAGILRDRSFAKMEPEIWSAVLDVHLNGAYNVTRPAFNAMKERGYGRILFTSSAAGLYGNFGQTNYSAAKMGLVGLMNTLKLEGDKYGIKVNTIAPIAASRLTEDVLPPDMHAKSKPEFVAPLVLFLSSRDCPVSGGIYNGGMGFFNRAAVVTGSGSVLNPDGEPLTAETVRAMWKKAGALDGAQEYTSLSQQVGELLTAFTRPGSGADIPKDAREGAYASVEAVFAALPDLFVAEAAKGVQVIFQYNIDGSDQGDWICAVDRGTCTIEPGTHTQPNCTLAMQAGDFLDMMNGKLPAMQAYTSGKLKISGDIMKSQLIEKLFKI